MKALSLESVYRHLPSRISHQNEIVLPLLWPQLLYALIQGILLIHLLSVGLVGRTSQEPRIFTQCHPTDSGVVERMVLGKMIEQRRNATRLLGH